MNGVTAPKQERSARTMEALLDAAEAVLAEVPPEAASVAEISRRAGVTTGALYARFRDKEALLRALEERVYASFEMAMEDALRGDSGAGLRVLLDRIITATADLYRRHRGAIRAVRLSSLDDVERAGRVRAYNRGLLERVEVRLLEHRAEIRRSDPETAVGEVVVWVVSILRQQILFDDLAMGPAPAEQTRGLVELAFSYLTCPGGEL